MKKADVSQIHTENNADMPVGTEAETELELLYQEAEELNEISNSVIDLIDAKRFDEAEEVCRRLSRDYPDQVDGLERMARLYEAKGDKKQAAFYYRQTVEFMRSKDGFDPENIEWHLEQAQRLEMELGD
jgi:tetratricopeptide (TPR) repeat protein